MIASVLHLYARLLRSGRTAVFSAILFCFATISLSSSPALAANEPSKKPQDKVDEYVIAVLVSSQEGSVSNTVEAIKYFSLAAIKSINQSGGINGLPVRALFLDDKENGELTVANIRQTLSQQKKLIAFVGLWSSTRGAKVVDIIGQSKVPFISEISLDKLFANHSNIFSLVRSVSDDLRIFSRFLKDNYKSAAFFGLEDDLFTKKFHQAFAQMEDGPSLSVTHWTPTGKPLDPTIADQFITDLKAKAPEVICLAVGSSRGGAVVEKLNEAGISVPIYTATGSINRILRNTKDRDYKGPMFQTRATIPNVSSEKLASLKRQPGFLPADVKFADDDLAYGIIYNDMIGLIWEAATGANNNINELRQHITANLKGFAQGKKVYQGNWRHWSFTPERSASETPFVLWRPKNSQSLRLWPNQYFPTSTGMEQLPVIYANIDMVRIYQIDSNKKSFDAEFYFSLQSDQNTGIEAIEFTNALRGDANNKPLISIREVNIGANEPTKPLGEKLYKIQGRFLFEPRLKNYPFDEQRFPISFQPVNATAPIFVQPPPEKLRDTKFDIDGWTILKGEKSGYVGSEQEIVSVVQDYVSEQRILSFYKFNFSWIGKRNALDYYLRVVVPLALIMTIAYFSIFVPNAKFESVVAIQVTALLSAIALYLAIPKLDTDSATLSDQIFVFTETAICLMIALSIIRVNIDIKNAPILGWGLASFQVVIFPILALLMFRYVSTVSANPTQPHPENVVFDLFDRVSALIQQVAQ